MEIRDVKHSTCFAPFVYRKRRIAGRRRSRARADRESCGTRATRRSRKRASSTRISPTGNSNAATACSSSRAVRPRPTDPARLSTERSAPTATARSGLQSR